MIVAPLIGLVLRPDHDAASRNEQRKPLPVVTHDWSQVAACESSGDWTIDSGNGYFGGLQISLSTWAAFGGDRYAERPDLATKAQQIRVAEHILAGQGAGAWPVRSQGTLG